MEIVGYIHHIPIVIKKVKKLYLDTQSPFQKRNGCCSVYEFIPQLSGVTSQQGRVLPISEGLVAVNLCAYFSTWEGSKVPRRMSHAQLMWSERALYPLWFLPYAEGLTTPFWPQRLIFSGHEHINLYSVWSTLDGIRKFSLRQKLCISDARPNKQSAGSPDVYAPLSSAQLHENKGSLRPRCLCS